MIHIDVNEQGCLMAQVTEKQSMNFGFRHSWVQGLQRCHQNSISFHFSALLVLASFSGILSPSGGKDSTQ